MWEQIVSFFMGRGWSKAQSQGIAGNLYGESGFKTNAIGDGGKAYGLAQWHPDRQSIFERVFGKSIKGSSFEEQLSFVDWELKNTESKAGNILRQQTTVEGATDAVMRHYERPANYSSYDSRLNAAMGNTKNAIINIIKPPPVGSSISDYFKWAGNVLTGKGSATQEEIDDWTKRGMDIYNDLTPSIENIDPTGIVAWIKSFFTGEMAGRFAAVLIGIILVGLAIAAFTLLSDNKTEIIKTVTDGV